MAKTKKHKKKYQNGGTVPDGDKDKKKKKKTSGEKYRKDYLNYMNHPSYKKRLGREMFGDKKQFSRDEKKQIEDVYQKRLNNIKDAEILINNNVDKPEQNYEINKMAMRTTPYSEGRIKLDRSNPNSPIKVEAGKGAVYHELSHTAERAGSYNPENNIKEQGFLNKLNPIIEKRQGIPKDLEYSYNKLNEKYGKKALNYLDANKDKYPDYEINMYKSIIKDNNSGFYVAKRLGLDISKDDQQVYEDMSTHQERIIKSDSYYSQPTEVKARLNNLRMKAKKEHGYDINKDFNINDYPELKKDVDYKHLKYYLDMEGNDINELMDYVADAGIDQDMQQSQPIASVNDNNTRLQNGGAMPKRKYASGGTLPYGQIGGMLGQGVQQMDVQDGTPSAGGGAASGALTGAGTGAMIGSVVPGIGTAIGAGAGALIGGISGYVKGQSAEEAAEEQQAAAIRQQRFSNMPTAEQQNMMYQQSGMANGGQIMNGMPMNDQVTSYDGGNGQRDSISLGDIAMVDDGEVRVGDYIFSNKLKYNKDTTYADRVKDILKDLGWDEKKEEFKRGSDEATKNTLNKLVGRVRDKQEQDRANTLPEQNNPAMKPQMFAGGNIPPYLSGLQRDYVGGRIQFGDAAQGQQGGDLLIGGQAGGFSDYTTQRSNMSNPEGASMMPLTEQQLQSRYTTKDVNLSQNTVNPLGYASMGLGALYNIGQGLSGAEEERYQRVNVDPEEVNLAEQRRDIQRQSTAAQRGLAQGIGSTARSAGQAMSNLAAGTASVQGQTGSALAGSAMREDTANVQARNQAERTNEMYNAQIQRAETIANAANRAKAKDMISAGITDVGMAGASYVRDKQAAQAENIRNEMMRSLWDGDYFQAIYGEDGKLKFQFKNDQ